MSNGKLRERLFDRGVKAIQTIMAPQLFIDHPQVIDRYPCPICMRWFSRESITEVGGNSALTLEDVPPKSFPGRSTRLALTCADCNHGSGKFEADLSRYASTVSGSPTPVPVVVSNEAFAVNGYLHAGPRVQVELVRNNPAEFAKLIATAPGGSGSVTARITGRQPYDAAAASLALIKSGFVAVFAALGYSWVVSPSVGPVREMLVGALHSGRSPSIPPTMVVNESGATMDGRRLALVTRPVPALLAQFGRDAAVLPTFKSPADLYERLGGSAGSPVTFGLQPIAWPTAMKLAADFEG